MMRFKPSLQVVILGPALALMLLSGVALYFLVLRTVSSYADENIRDTLDALLRSAVTIADSEVERQNRESQMTEPVGARGPSSGHARVRTRLRSPAMSCATTPPTSSRFSSSAPPPRCSPSCR